ncbi:phosphoribosylglycinamide formyltransferase [Pseudoxanthomonas spadix]|uniref:phosphoribosylglycinamide formyltransferase n=1 Tax=Pseudoxanthomonas spadix TaxID=415229 RepID=UPI000EFE3610|nr:phosphoribosylglycinamide formyltransferase [Pseudoxanthomonas spadix]MBP3973509.1 phosphoribosylglycinamide formyltransferase [Pseudoxanthomonas spadix]RMW94892.1 phosphoribosylglycinamide formyltransferase [Pseudoxanthomonas spadix]
MTSSRIAVLASGRGSNLQALLDAIAAGTLQAQVVGVFCDRPGAPALLRVPSALRWSARPVDFPDRDGYEQALGDALAASGADWIVCAGYMRILGAALVARFSGRMLNIHPSLLPRHRGLHTHAAALASGDAEHGASVHFIIPELDAGAVIAQARLAISPQDTADSLAARVLALEHRLLPAVLRLAVAGRLAERGGTALVDGQPMFTPLTLDSHDRLMP